MRQSIIAKPPVRINEMQPPSPRNPSLDGLRGIAVILTYLVHYCGSYLAVFRGANPNVVTLDGWPGPFDKTMYWLFRSHHGVYIFFILSGYLIAKISLGPRFFYVPFLRNRLVRIYPAFLLALIACIAIEFFVRQTLPSARTLILNLLFLNGFPPAHVDGIVFNNVTWSLFYEMMFYVSFPAVLIWARYLRLPVLVSIVLTGLLVSYGPAAFFYSELFLLMFVGAVGGALAPGAIKAVANGLPDVVVIGAYGLVTGLMTTGYLTQSQFVWVFAGLGFLLLAKAADGQGLLARGLALGPLAGLGRISYSFYLLHSIAIAASFKLWRHLIFPGLGPEINALYMGLLGFAGAVLLGWISFIVAESFYFTRRKPAGAEAIDIPRRRPDTLQEHRDDCSR